MKLKIKNIYIFLIGAIVIAVITMYYLSLPKVSYTPLKEHTEHVRGMPDAQIRIVEYSDFQCSYCARAQPTLDQILSSYEGEVKLIFKHFPLQFHQYAKKSAEAAECADDQEKFWEYHDKLFENQNALTTNDLKRYASEIGLDTELFDACLDSGTMASRVREDTSEGQKFGVSGTPTFLIDGQKVVGAESYSVFQQIIDAELG